MVHIDVMDGHFVPQVTYGQPVIKSIRNASDLIFDTHLMIERPEASIASYAECGSDYITFHYESTNHADLCVGMIHKLGRKAGVAVCPSTPVDVLRHLLPVVDLVLVMTVNPGFGGQQFIPYTLEKVRELCELKKNNGYSYLISVDGGVNNETLPKLIEAGIDVAVSGSSFFKGELKW